MQANSVTLERKLFIVAPSTTSKSNSMSWYLDSGASQHMIPNRHWFIEFRKLINPEYIYVGDGSHQPVKGQGTVVVQMENNQTNILRI